MAGGSHHEPPVLTHFLPGMVAGIVLGGVLGTLFIAHLAAGSLQTFWERTRPTPARLEVACADISGVRVTSENTDSGSSYASVAVGDGVETVFTMSADLLRTVPITSNKTMYLTAVSDAAQVAAFPANSLYRIDFCEKTITHILGDTNESVRILGMSDSGVWVLYASEGGLLIMNTKEHRVMSLAETALLANVVFSPFDDALAIEFTDGSRSEWILTNDTNAFTRKDAATSGALPAWAFQSAEDYFAEIK